MHIHETGVRGRMYQSIKIALIVLGALLVLLAVYLIRDYFALRRESAITVHELSLTAFVKKHGPLTADEVGAIRPWMTFDYVNKTFALPADFLKNNFTISDSHYPNLTLAKFAAERNFFPTEFTLEVETAIGNYLKQR